jgi:hypothetical protein
MHVIDVMYDTDETTLDPEEERTGVYGRRYPRPSSMYPMARIDNETGTEEVPTVTARRATARSGL